MAATTSLLARSPSIWSLASRRCYRRNRSYRYSYCACWNTDIGADAGCSSAMAALKCACGCSIVKPTCTDAGSSAAPAPAPWPASTPASTTRSPRVTTPPRPQVAPSTSPHPHPASWIRVAPSASGYLDPRRPIHIRLPRYFVADRFFGGSRRCAGVAEVPTFTQASESHQRRITEAILEHALKICSDKNVVVGDPKEKICEVAAELKADLLVMGCGAFGPFKRMFLGSVSNYCINSVGCPVVVIKGT
nr:uncharacterized protein LOC109774327 [Aegilops tauschii subsp. strangulata]